jgi:hypothetical protein
MKKAFFITLFLILVCTVKSQAQPETTATMKSSSRLFSMKDDLTSVILLVPADSVVTVLGSDSTYYHVVYQDYEGYILKKHAVPDKAPAIKKTTQQQTRPVQQQEQEQSRFSYLEDKYGTNMAVRLNSGKIWKGMNSAMVIDSWGNAQKINRIIDGNTIKEEWIYTNTWLYFEDNTLLEWGAVKK